MARKQKGSLKTVWNTFSGCFFILAIPVSHFQAETFAKPVTDGASAARRHLVKSVMRCSISNGSEPPPLHFRFQAALSHKAA
ncbi:hypothetical protein [Kingella sp. (in: b-proteobacteria)]|uniref:hypothetical protein n=1 Tax=Kingella sp. (in: b-proteobacteria) TaxID=2020713 RepID=UPI0026DA953B|nr:hypothetical protein [Kingella sp. (in: b-proteobacteria)]MDO4658024.1 hypothetical protein [Kingella sp. (in: b-proteobacteria)]